jgi:hypothetical protein
MIDNYNENIIYFGGSAAGIDFAISMSARWISMIRVRVLRIQTK